MAKWHRELEIFTKIKPIIILDGNVLDVYQYPVDGTTVKGSIVRLTDYLYYFFMDRGYKSIVEYDSLQGFHNDCNPDMVDSFAELCGAGQPHHGEKCRHAGGQPQCTIRVFNCSTVQRCG